MQPVFAASFALLALTPTAAIAPPQDPAALDAVKAELAASCPAFARNIDLTRAVTRLDLNGDGVDDYAVNEQKARCFRWSKGDTTIAKAGCRTTCRSWIIMSGTGGSYAVAWQGSAFNMGLGPGNQLLAQTRTDCRSARCTFSLVWTGETLEKRPATLRTK